MFRIFCRSGPNLSVNRFQDTKDTRDTLDAQDKRDKRDTLDAKDKRDTRDGLIKSFMSTKIPGITLSLGNTGSIGDYADLVRLCFFFVADDQLL